jgi:hypothetical protein
MMNPCGRPFSPSPTAPCGAFSGRAGRIAIEDGSFEVRLTFETKSPPALACDMAIEHPNKIATVTARALTRSV